MIVGLVGLAGAGKDTTVKVAIDLLKQRGFRAVSIACADPIKELCQAVFSVAYGTSRETFYGNQQQKSQEISGLPGWTGRKILQYIGTDCFHPISNELWARYAVNSAKDLLDHQVDVVFISDVRFASEAKAIKDNNGTIIKIQRPSLLSVDQHISEKENSQIEADFTVVNDEEDAKLTKLTYSVENILCELGFLPSTSKPRDSTPLNTKSSL